MDIIKATRLYEKWLERYTTIVMPDLERKHQVMASGPFPFLRATFYRWLQRWNVLGEDLLNAPTTLSVGDLHVENYGTWRDAEGRLVWGINDFDEAGYLPYTQDMVRLMVSAILASEASSMKVSGEDACAAIFAGYCSQIKTDGKPFVIAEDHDWLRPIALGSLRDPVKFWNKLCGNDEIAPTTLPAGALTALETALPAPANNLPVSYHKRVAGMGSLGHQRYVAIGNQTGGHVAREVKALVPSSIAWITESPGAIEILYPVILRRSVRCSDPFVALHGQWIVRRLAPDCSKIEIGALQEHRDELRLLTAMGQELANIHCGSAAVLDEIRADLDRRNKSAGDGWYMKAVLRLTDAMKSDHADWAKR